jgi:hypothetical protein
MAGISWITVSTTGSWVIKTGKTELRAAFGTRTCPVTACLIVEQNFLGPNRGASIDRVGYAPETKTDWQGAEELELWHGVSM